MSIFRVATLGLFLVSAGAIHAGGDAGYGGSGSSVGLSAATSKSVDNTLSRGFSRCENVDWVYRYDCYRLVYKRSGDKLRGNTAYSEAQKALDLVENTLSAAIAKNRDPGTKPKRRGFEVYTPVKPSALPRMKQQTRKAIQQAETILLRAPEEKQVYYSRIADALNSNKALLRSALLKGVQPGSTAVRLAAVALHRLARLAG